MQTSLKHLHHNIWTNPSGHLVQQQPLPNLACSGVPDTNPWMFHVWHPTLRTMSQQLKMLSHQLIILKTVGLKDYFKKKKQQQPEPEP